MFGRFGTGNRNNVDTYNLHQGVYGISMNGEPCATLNFDPQFSQNFNQQFDQRFENVFDCEDNESMRIPRNVMLDELNSPNSIEFWCKRTSKGFQCTICNAPPLKTKWNLKRHVQKNEECKKVWDQKKSKEQWIIFSGKAAGA